MFSKMKAGTRGKGGIGHIEFMQMEE